jgi:arylsulfatase A-like enzyme
VVLDTTRADAVSAYGHQTGTTPTVDALARDGILYRRAYSNANWTLPSHASLFTGLFPSQHGVRYGSEALPDTVITLAEALRQRGYETAAFSENPWLGASTRTDRGFERSLMPLKVPIDAAVADWLAHRDRKRPFFVFLNIMDAHWPYLVRATNPFLPAGVTRERAEALVASSPMLCTWNTGDPEAAILHGLYLGDVQAADAKLGALLRQIAPPAGETPPVVIVTSDHGEYLGEGGLLEHGLGGMGGPVLRVPLVVHGLPRTASTIIDTPVQLVDVAPSILTWAGAPVPPGVAGRLLPTRPPPAQSAPVIAQHWDSYTNESLPREIRDVAAWRRSRCAPDRKIVGDTHTIVRFPYKLVWYAQYAPELFNLETDPNEQHDLAPTMPSLVSSLSGELTQLLTAPAVAARSTMDPTTAERLRALGYAVPAAAP